MLSPAHTIEQLLHLMMNFGKNKLVFVQPQVEWKACTSGKLNTSVMQCRQQAHAEMGDVHDAFDSVILSETPLTRVDVLNQVFQIPHLHTSEDRSLGCN